MKRVLTILLIIVIILGILLTGAWLLARRSAKRAGVTPPTFREFITTGSKTPSKNPATGTISSIFSPTDGSSGNQNPGSSPFPQSGVRISQFTNNTIAPAMEDSGQGGVVDPGTGGTGNGGGTGGSGGTGNGGGTGGSGGGGGVIQTGCSDADTNITFTAAELARLQQLQNRFYAVAQYLRNDTDVANELANYDSFKTKVNKYNELYQYCQAKTPLLADQALRRRVPTPFWHDATEDKGGFTTDSGSVGGTVALDDMNRGHHIIEQQLHLNLW